MEIFFETRKLTKNFDALIAVNRVDFKLEKGEIVGLIGPNGAGKSTFLNIVAGVIKATSGIVIFKDKDITNKKAYEVCRIGIVKTSQIVKPFTNLTLIENIFLASVYGAKRDKRYALHKANELLEFVGLYSLKDNYASQLSVPQRRRLEFARALATEPEILLLDENMAGLTPKEIDDMLEIIREINRKGITIVVVEHILRAVMGVAQRVVVFNYGEKIADGDPNEVINSPEVQKAYFGEE